MLGCFPVGFIEVAARGARPARVYMMCLLLK